VAGSHEPVDWPTGSGRASGGVHAALRLIWTTTPTDNKASYTMITLGVSTALVVLLSLAGPDRVAFAGLIAFMGLLLVLSPWVIGFTALAWSA
jgi:hypothetical protein